VSHWTSLAPGDSRFVSATRYCHLALTCNLVLLLSFQEKCVRLFDRGDLNSYKDELGFVDAVADASKQLPVEAGAISCQALREKLAAQWRDLSADVERLSDVINSRTVGLSFEPKYQRQCVEDAVTLARKSSATDWLRLVLRTSHE
jgi:hypothetical protein